MDVPISIRPKEKVLPTACARKEFMKVLVDFEKGEKMSQEYRFVAEVKLGLSTTISRVSTPMLRGGLRSILEGMYLNC
jgi:hypothetical protein